MNYYLLLKKQAASLGEKPFLYMDEEIYSYDDFYRVVEERAGELPDFLGNDLQSASVLAAAASFFEQAVLFFALQKLAVRPILLHHGLTQEDVEGIAEANGLQALISLTASEISCKRFPHEARQHESADCLGVLSSGTTGVPKVMYRTFESWAGFFPVQNEIFGVGEGARLFLHGSLSFTGNLNAFLAALFAGASVCTSEYTRVKAWRSVIEKHAADTIYLVPAKLRLLMEASEKPLPGVKSMFAGSQLISASLLHPLRKRLPNAAILLYYGASELNYITYTCCEDSGRDPNNLGKPFPGVRVSTLDGLIYVDTPFHVSGIAMPFTLHDRGRLNEHGELIFEGREEACVNKGGFKISLARVEMKLREIAGVRDAAVLAVEDDLRGAELAAFLVVADDAEKKAVRRAVRRVLLPVEMPRVLRFCTEIPLNDRGKVAKDILLQKISAS